jgi:hypothetical protein
MTDEMSGGGRARTVRIIAVTGGLAVVGAMVGAATGAVALILVSIAQGARTLHMITFGSGFAAMFGAVVGAVLAPIEAWVLLRRVPLWRAITGTAVGTIIGATALAFTIVGPIVGGVAGFTAAAIALRLRRERRAASLPPGSS